MTTDWTWTLCRARTDEGQETGTVLHIGGDYGEAFCKQWVASGATGYKAGVEEINWLADQRGRTHKGHKVCQNCLKVWRTI